MKKIAFLLLATGLFWGILVAQNVGIGIATPTHKLHVVGDVRVSTLAGTGTRPVYATNLGVLTVTPPNPDVFWRTLGNTGIGAAHFLGTINNADLNIRTNNALRFRIENWGARLRANDNGSAGAPNYSWISDTDIGMYRITTNTLGFSTAGVERFRLETGEAVVNEGGLDYDFRVETNNQPDFFVINANVIGGDGGIGINTTNPAGVIHMNINGEWGNIWLTQWDNVAGGNTGAMARFQHTATTNGSRVVLGVTNYSGSAYNAPGIMGLSLNNTTTGTGGRGVYGSANNESGRAVEGYLYYVGGYSGWAGYFNADVYCAGTYFGSDKRLKKDIAPITSALSIITQLNPVSFNYDTEKYPGLDGTRLHYGFVAQELEKVLPDLVKEKIIDVGKPGPITAEVSSLQTEQGVFKVVDYVSVVPILTQAVKEQQEIIKKLEEKINALEKDLEQLKN